MMVKYLPCFSVEYWSRFLSKAYQLASQTYILDYGFRLDFKELAELVRFIVVHSLTN